jgi:virginiamycin B lyase
MTPLAAYAQTQAHIFKATFKENIVPTPSAFDQLHGGMIRESDGGFWFTESAANKIARFSSAAGTFREYQLLTPGAIPSGIARSADGSIWFTENGVDKIGRITTNGVINEFPAPAGFKRPYAITLGPDRALWFTDQFSNVIGRITPSGATTSFTLPLVAGGSPGSNNIISGPDGALWFTMKQGYIGRITTSGVSSFDKVPTAGSDPFGLALGADRNIWFTEHDSNRIGRLNPWNGFMTEFPIPTAHSGPADIVNLGNCYMAFTEEDGSQIGYLSLTGEVTEFPTKTFNAQPLAIVASGYGVNCATETSSSANKIACFTVK